MRTHSASLSMNSVPGVITFESNGLVFRGGGNDLPSRSSSARRNAMAFFFSSLSMAARNRRDRCWFIFARGAFIRMASSELGRVVSTYPKIAECNFESTAY